jgi:hypothetical protein
MIGAMDDPQANSPQSTHRPRRPITSRARISIAVAVAIAAGLIAWLILRSSSSSPATTPGTTLASTTPAPATDFSTPIAVTTKGLAARAAAVQHPIYWAGPQPGDTYELTTTTNGRTYVRYLPPGVPVGDKQPNFLTVGTYPVPGAYAVAVSAAKASGWHTFALANGVAVYSNAKPTSVYVAYKGSNFQIEVYDPSSARARQVAKARLAPVG